MVFLMYVCLFVIWCLRSFFFFFFECFWWFEQLANVYMNVLKAEDLYLGHILNTHYSLAL